VDKVKRQYPKKFIEQATVDVRHPLKEFLGLASPESRQRYYADLDTYYNEYRKYLECREIVEEARARSFWFDLWLQNNGNGLANDIDVFLRFPASIIFLAEKESKEAEVFEYELKPPQPPEAPGPLGLARLRLSEFSLKAEMPNVFGLKGVLGEKWISGATVRRNDDDTNEIHMQLAKLKHGHNVCLGTFMITFKTREEVRPFNAECWISTAELVDKTSLQLPFRARLKSESR
jgi:hypothetical protein